MRRLRLLVPGPQNCQQHVYTQEAPEVGEAMKLRAPGSFPRSSHISPPPAPHKGQGRATPAPDPAPLSLLSLSTQGPQLRLVAQRPCSWTLPPIQVPCRYAFMLVLVPESFCHFFFGHTFGMWKFLGQKLNPCHYSNRSCCSDNAESLTYCTTRELLEFSFLM